MADPIEDLIMSYITDLRAEWRLYPDIYAADLAVKIREVLVEENT